MWLSRNPRVSTDCFHPWHPVRVTRCTEYTTAQCGPKHILSPPLLALQNLLYKGGTSLGFVSVAIAKSDCPEILLATAGKDFKFYTSIQLSWPITVRDVLSGANAHASIGSSQNETSLLYSSSTRYMYEYKKDSSKKHSSLQIAERNEIERSKTQAYSSVVQSLVRILLYHSSNSAQGCSMHFLCGSLADTCHARERWLWQRILAELNNKQPGPHIFRIA